MPTTLKNRILFKVSFLLSFWVYEYSYYIHYQSKDCQYKEAQRKVFVFLILRLETTVILSSWSMFILGANNLVYRSKYNNCFIRRANSRGNLKPYDSLTLTWNRRNLNTLNQEFNAYAKCHTSLTTLTNKLLICKLQLLKYLNSC